MTNKIKLLIISGEYPPMEGGVADFTAILAERLLQRGAEIHILTSEQATSHDANEAITVHAVMNDWGFRSLYRTLRQLTSEWKPDVINIQYQTAAYGLHPAINLLPRFFRSTPCVVTFHDLRPPYLFPKAGRLRETITLELARQCDAVIVTNAQDRARLEQAGGIRHIEMIPIGSNISYQLPPGYDRGVWRGQWGVSSRTTLLSFFGFLNESKGAIELIQALKKLRDEGHNVELVMIGGAVSTSNASNQAYYDRVKNTIAELGLEDCVFWTGYMAREEVSAAFVSSDICVLPFLDGASFRRGSLMAALTHGVPIISTTPEIPLPELVHGENIYLVPPGDPDAIAEAIRVLASDPALRERLGRGARELSRLFDWERISDRTMELFRQVIARRRNQNQDPASKGS